MYWQGGKFFSGICRQHYHYVISPRWKRALGGKSAKLHYYPSWNSLLFIPLSSSIRKRPLIWSPVSGQYRYGREAGPINRFLGGGGSLSNIMLFFTMSVWWNSVNLIITPTPLFARPYVGRIKKLRILSIETALKTQDGQDVMTFSWSDQIKETHWIWGDCTGGCKCIIVRANNWSLVAVLPDI